MHRYLVFILLLILSAPVSAKLNVFACEPEWHALVKELGGDQVKSFSATTAMQDPHHIQARPSLMARMRRADLVVCTGADLEAGWLPVLLRRAGRQQVQPGGIGYLEAARQVTLLDIPSRLDRSMGDVHAAGNPHIHTDPRNVLKVAGVLTERLKTLDPDHAAMYEMRGKDFGKRWQQAITRWQHEASVLRGVPIVVQHKSWIYLSHWLGLQEVATLEAKPGIPPTVSHLSDVVHIAKQRQARMIIRAAYQDARASEWLADRTGLPVVVLPFTVGGNANAADLFGLYDETLRLLLAGAGHGS